MQEIDFGAASEVALENALLKISANMPYTVLVHASQLADRKLPIFTSN